MVVENKPPKRINFSSRSQGGILKSKSDRKKVISEKRQAAHTKREAIKTKLEATNKKRDELLKLAQDANPEDEEKLKNDIAQLEKDIQSEQMEIDEADKEIDEADKADKDIDMLAGESNGDDGEPDTAEALSKAFREGLNLDETICTYKQADTTLRGTQSIIGYKQGSGHGRVAIVAELDVKGHQIYRIRRDVIVSSDEVDIIQTRRAGTGVLGKGDRGNIKWKSDDIDHLIGIAIEVPPGYKGNPEDLVLPIPRLSDAEKEERKAKGERLPKQADVQLIICWKYGKEVKGISNDYKFSFESRNGCQSIYGTAKKAAHVLYDLAKTAEQKYRDNGGLYSVEEALPELDPFAWTPIGSRQGSEEPGDKKNNKEKAGDKKPEDEQKRQEEEEEKKKQEEQEEKKKQAEDKRKLDDDEKSKKKKFELFFRSQEGIDQNSEFTVDQAIKFKNFYEKASAL